jgi:hypothetical protein
MKSILFFFVPLVFFSSIIIGCAKKEVLNGNEYISYIIPKGKQRSANKLNLMKGNELVFSFVFDSTAVYTTQEPANQYSINKLYGFSDCNSKHQENSARLGWRWLNDQLELLAYCYSESERCSEFITTAEIGKEYTCRMVIDHPYYYFTIDNQTIRMERGCNNGNMRYILFPYFGGTETAPHDIKIRIRQNIG